VKQFGVFSLVLVQPPKNDAQAWFAQAWLFFIVFLQPLKTNALLQPLKINSLPRPLKPPFLFPMQVVKIDLPQPNVLTQPLKLYSLLPMSCYNL
jgi:hypothetical protein